MKLTETQKQHIMNFLIVDQGLKYKEFIDEMNDHFIDSIEAKMDAGISFVDPLEATANEFKNEIYYPFPFGLFPVKGLRALEMRFYESKNREMNAEVVRSLKSFAFSFINLLIICYAVAIVYYFQDSYFLRSAVLFAWLIPSSIIAFYLKSTLKGNSKNTVGLSWVFSSKQDRVHTLQSNLLLHQFNIRFMQYALIIHFAISFADGKSMLPEIVISILGFILIATTLLFQVQALKIITQKNKSIEA